MEIAKLTLAILATFLVFAERNPTSGQKLVVFPGPFFSSDMGASKGILKTQNIIESEETPQRIIPYTENDAHEEKNFECTIKDKGTTAEDQEATTSVGVTTVTKDDCMFGWSSWNTSCYLFVQVEKTWDGAKEACYSHDMCAHLVFIESDAENEFIIDLIDRELAKTGLSSDVWLGLIKVDGEWKWYNTTAKLPASGPRKIRVSSSEDEFCARISRSRGNEWHDKKCFKYNYFFVCETRKVE